MKKPLILFLFTIMVVMGTSLSSSSKPLGAQQTATYVGPETCSTCHSTQYTAWNTSLHSTMIRNLTTALLAEYGIDGPATDPKSAAYHNITVSSNFPYTIGGNWKLRFINATADPNDPSKWTVATWQYVIATGEWKTYHPEAPKDWGSSCAQCHTTGFDSATETFYGVEISDSITCESCHGPGGDHITNPTVNKMIIDVSAQVCGQCHVRGTFPEYEIGDPTSFNFTSGAKAHGHRQQFIDWNMSEHSEELEVFLTDTCLNCKSADNIFNTELITLLDVLITADNATNPVTCVSCHEGHELTLWITRENTTSYPYTLPSMELGGEADWNTVCIQCHTAGGRPEVKVKETWHHAQGEFFINSTHYVSDVTCVHCHMPLDTKSAVAYDLRNHTMIVESYGTYDYSCGQAVGCHQEQGTEWAEERVEEIQATVSSVLEDTNDTITSAETAIITANATAGINQTAVDYAVGLLAQAKSYFSFVEADGSKGFHNPTYALSLLNTAMDYASQAESVALEALRQAQVSSLEAQVSNMQNIAIAGIIGALIAGLAIGVVVQRRRK